MKIIRNSLLCLLLLLSSGSLFSQGNLQFNQVVTVNMSGVLAGTVSRVSLVTSQPITVPAGKVWKIESVLANLNRGSHTQTSVSSHINGLSGSAIAPMIYLDNILISASTFGTNYDANQKTLWLPAGSYTLYLYAYESTTYLNQAFSAMVSAIEFNVVP